MLKISYAGCLGLSPVISAQFTLEMHVTDQNREKFTKPLFFWGGGVQGHSRSLVLTFLRSSSPMLLRISSISVYICNYFYAQELAYL